MVAISVIIPCYNLEKYIGDCLDSVFYQTFKDFEVIIVDDGSTDKSVEIIKSYQSRFSNILLIEQDNKGVIEARNLAIKKAQGKYIYTLDGDDLIASTVLEKSYNAIEKNLGDIITCKSQSFHFVGDLRQASSKQKFLKPTKFNMLKACCLTNSALFRKKDFEECGGYDLAFQLGWEDYDLWLNLIVKHGKKAYRLDEYLFFYRLKNCDESRNEQARSHKKHLNKILIKKYPVIKWVWLLQKILLVFFQKKITKKNQTLIKIFKFPVFKKKIKKNTGLFWYHKEKNFGDLLNLDLMNFFFKQVRTQPSKTSSIVAIGSLLDVFLEKTGKKKQKNPVVVYGTGFIKPQNGKDEFMRPLKIYAVRGYLSLKRLQNCSDVSFKKNFAIGDPGLLVSRFFDVTGVQKKYKLGIIPHYVDKNNPLLNKISVQNSIILDIQEPPETLLPKIAACETILSSAMHGLIASDSLHIPNIRMILSDNIIGADYKFDDYYSVFGIDEHAKIDLRERSFEEKDVEIIKKNYPIKRETVKQIQSRLIESFPFEF